MALPLKSGADLYNNQALRMRLHNLGADPTEVGAGLIYFNTSSGLNTSGKARLYTGSGWKTFAFEEDLDVASNADFVALKARVGVVEGYFASGIANQAAKVTNKLSIAFNGTTYEFDGSADKTITFSADNIVSAIGTKPVNRATADANGNNIASTYALKSSLTAVDNRLAVIEEFFAGDTDQADNMVNKWNEIVEFLNATEGDTLDSLLSGKADATTVTTLAGRVSIAEGNITTLQGHFSSGIAKKATADALGNVIASTYATKEELNAKDTFDQLYAGVIHSDVINAEKMYADVFEGALSGNAASATKLATARTIWGQSFDGTGNITGSLQLNNNIAIYVKNTSGAFKDALKMSSSDNFMIGYGVSEAGHNTYLEGNNLFLRYGQSHTTGLILNSSGNVTIGSSDLAGTDYKLYVAGTGRFTGAVTLNSTLAVTGASTFNNNVAINGDLHVSGNIIADGEVSAGGAGEEGSTEGSGGTTDKVVLTIDANPTSNSIPLTHNLATTDVSVTIYEWNANSSTWDMILTDVSIVNETTINVTFGSIPTVQHKVIIMG